MVSGVFFRVGIHLRSFQSFRRAEGPIQIKQEGAFTGERSSQAAGPGRPITLKNPPSRSGFVPQMGMSAQGRSSCTDADGRFERV
jgi:hypothetical protein